MRLVHLDAVVCHVCECVCSVCCVCEGLLRLTGGSRDHGTSVEAGRWFNQAWNDLLAARNDFEGDRPAPEWVCFKCHQVTTHRCVTDKCFHSPTVVDVFQNSRNKLWFM